MVGFLTGDDFNVLFHGFGGSICCWWILHQTFYADVACNDIDTNDTGIGELTDTSFGGGDVTDGAVFIEDVGFINVDLTEEDLVEFVLVERDPNFGFFFDDFLESGGEKVIVGFNLEHGHMTLFEKAFEKFKRGVFHSFDLFTYLFLY
jgi:hypothetical protein